MGVGVVGPATAAGHVQRVAAETGVHEVAENATVQATEVVAHGHVPQLHVERRGEQAALVTQLGQASVETAVVFLDGQTVANQILGGAIAASVVDGQLDSAGVIHAIQLAEVKLRAELDVLRVTGGTVQAAIGVVGGFAAVIAGEFDAVLIQLVAQTAPITGQGIAGQQVRVGIGEGGQGGAAGQAQQQAAACMRKANSQKHGSLPGAILNDFAKRRGTRRCRAQRECPPVRRAQRLTARRRPSRSRRDRSTGAHHRR
ncbi:hypothetical protein D3C76_859280 [compost metagenome]